LTQIKTLFGCHFFVQVSKYPKSGEQPALLTTVLATVGGSEEQGLFPHPSTRRGAEDSICSAKITTAAPEQGFLSRHDGIRSGAVLSCEHRGTAQPATWSRQSSRVADGMSAV
jgi:hypothetical protein